MKLTEKQKQKYVELAKKTLAEHPQLAERYAPIGRKYLATMEVVKMSGGK